MTQPAPEADEARPVPDYPERTFSAFLADTPPGIVYHIPDLTEKFNQIRRVVAPDVLIHCVQCEGERFFRQENLPIVANWSDTVVVRDLYLSYNCRNCEECPKNYAVRITVPVASLNGFAIKYGELPAFGPPLPPKVITLIRPDRELFIRGRRCEYQGLGIAAFSYYRRVVENQKTRLIKEMARVAKRLGADGATLESFERAAKEMKFAKAVDDIKDAIPQSLLIEGHNPLALLHNALSEGLHGLSDEDCLSLAVTIRVVLTELAERMELALRENAELKQHLSTLLSRRRPT